MSVSKRQRFEVFKRDNFTCQYCGRTPPTVVLECDHIIAKSKGGSNHHDNLITACFDCNNGKSNKDLKAIVPSQECKLELAKERARQLASYNKFISKQRQKTDATIEALGIRFYNEFARADEIGKYTFDVRQHQSVRYFLEHLSISEVTDAIDIATSKSRGIVSAFKYFCGVCWTMIKSQRKERT